MKSLLRNTVVHAFSLFLALQVLPGVKVAGGLFVYLFAGFVLSMMSLIIRPIINVVTLPLNFATFGAFSILTNAFILYLLTIFVPEVSITPFVYPGASVAGFVVPKIVFGSLTAFVAASLALFAIVSFVNWLHRSY